MYFIALQNVWNTSEKVRKAFNQHFNWRTKKKVINNFNHCNHVPTQLKTEKQLLLGLLNQFAINYPKHLLIELLYLSSTMIQPAYSNTNLTGKPPFCQDKRIIYNCSKTTWHPWMPLSHWPKIPLKKILSTPKM